MQRYRSKPDVLQDDSKIIENTNVKSYQLAFDIYNQLKHNPLDDFIACAERQTKSRGHIRLVVEKASTAIEDVHIFSEYVKVNDVNWRISVKRRKWETVPVFGVYLHCNKLCQCDYTFSLLNQLGRPNMEKKKISYTFERGFGWMNFITEQDLFNRKTVSLPNFQRTIPNDLPSISVIYQWNTE